jgi:DNA-binding MarR family transcriptional regulator
VALTAKGRRVIDAAMEEHVANEARLLAGLDADDRARLGGLLGRLATSLGV